MTAHEFSKLLAAAALAGGVAAMSTEAKADVQITASVGSDTASWSGDSITGPVSILPGIDTLTKLVVDPDPGFTIGDTFTDTRPYSPTAYADTGTYPNVAIQFLSSYTLPTPLVDGQTYAVTASIALTETANPGSINAQNAILTNDPAFGANIMFNDVGVCAAGIDLGGSGLGTTSNSTSLPFNGASTFVATPGCDSTLIADVVYLGNGGGTTYSLTESLSINAIPEPVSAALLGTGALLMFGASRRRMVG
jgi:hypothetical protein